MNNYWQMTLMELDRESVQPIKKLFHFGTYSYDCPICGDCVGFWRDPKFDKVTNGFTYKRDECKHGHKIDWEGVK